MLKTADNLKPGEQGVVTQLSGTGDLRRHIIDMGITPGAVIFMRKAAPLGDPLEINVRGYGLSLRKTEARCITVETSDEHVIAAKLPKGKGNGRRMRRHGHKIRVGGESQ